MFWFANEWRLAMLWIVDATIRFIDRTGLFDRDMTKLVVNSRRWFCPNIISSYETGAKRFNHRLVSLTLFFLMYVVHNRIVFFRLLLIYERPFWQLREVSGENVTNMLLTVVRINRGFLWGNTKGCCSDTLSWMSCLKLRTVHSNFQ